MQIKSDYTYDRKTANPMPGSYEWWYFDVLSSDSDYGVVLIFFEGNPFSRRYMEHLDYQGDKFINSARKFPALSVAIYKKRRPVYYGFTEFREDDATFDSDRIYGKAGGSEFTGTIDDDRLTYSIQLRQTLPCGDKVEGGLTFTSALNSGPNGLNKSQGDEDSDHCWNLVQPRSDVECDLTISGYTRETVRFNGIGYHDHNGGSEPLRNRFDEWYWGRFHLEESTFVYYLTQFEGQMKSQGWMIDSSGVVGPYYKDVRLTDKSWNVFGLKSARKIEFQGPSDKVFIQQESLVDNGPFYQRFISRALVQRSDGFISSNGISEFISPPRIHNKLFWPLVDMRIHYPDWNPHWVQKNSRLYRKVW